MLNFLTTILVLAVGFALIFSIIWNRVASHLGVRLLKTTAQIKFPLSESIQLDIESSDTPKRVVLKFNKSIGFYGGDISLENGGLEISRRKLPALPEYGNKLLGFYNEDIPRQTNTVVMAFNNYKFGYPLILRLNLDHNIQDGKLRDALDVTFEEEIEIVVRG